MKKSAIPLFTGRETAKALEVSQPRFARALRSGRVRADFIGNALDLFLPDTVRHLIAHKPQLFPR
jgi:hypothetical protein